MAKLTTLTLSRVLFAFLCVLDAGVSTTTSATSTVKFIETSCAHTLHPAVCFQSLVAYSWKIQNSPRLLAMMALSVSIKNAKLAKSFMVKLSKYEGLKPGEYVYEALKDCYEELSDSVDLLRKSAMELKYLPGATSEEYAWHMSNLQTWVSAALTDQSTCTDGFDDLASNGYNKSSVQARIDNLAEVTSNALALCNKLVKIMN